MTYQWLLFDADNTLFDFNLAEVKALESTFAEFSYPYNGRSGDIYRAINKQVWEQLEQGTISATDLRTVRFSRLFEAVGIQADTEPFSEAYLRHLGNCGDLIEGAESVIQQVSQRYRLGLITNGLADVQRPRLAASPLQPYFETVTISDEIGVAKPDPGIFDVTFEQMGYPEKTAVLIIGDSLSSDMQGGLNYGIDTCWYNPDNKPASLPVTYKIQRLDELYAILNKQQ
jgi:YjjG family noncanonical pyrimidine nucleotidase